MVVECYLDRKKCTRFSVKDFNVNTKNRSIRILLPCRRLKIPKQGIILIFSVLQNFFISSILIETLTEEFKPVNFDKYGFEYGKSLLQILVFWRLWPTRSYVQGTKSMITFLKDVLQVEICRLRP